MGLYDDAGLLDHVGFTSAIPSAERPALTTKLESLIEPPGFTGNAPGGPSRWNSERTGQWEPLMLLAGDRSYMGEYANKWLAKGLGWPFFVIVTIAALAAIPLYLLTSGGQG